MLRKAILSLGSRLEMSARRADRFVRLAQRELESRVPVPTPVRLHMMRSGFLSESYVIYQLAKNDRSQYLSDFQRYVRTPDLNGDYRLLLKDKLQFGLITRGFPPHDVESFGVIRRGQVFYTGRSGTSNAARYLLDLLRAHPRLVIKPVVGGGGEKVRLLCRQDDELLLNEKPLPKASLQDLVCGMKNDLISCYVVQCPETAAFFPRTVNTLRLLTMWDAERHEPFIAAAVLRIGRNSSYPVDNWTRGGLVAAIDLATGELSKGVSYPGRSPALTWHSEHPDSGARIEGVTLSRWSEIKTQLLEICRSVPFLEYVGWDLVLTADGFKVLEGNHFSDVNLLQVHRPLLADARVARFYEAHGVI